MPFKKGQLYYPVDVELGFTLSEIKGLLELRMDEDPSCSEIKKKHNINIRMW